VSATVGERTGTADHGDRLRSLVRPTVRTLPWGPLSAAGLLAAGLAATAGLGEPSLDAAVERVRFAAVVLAVGMAGTLDDPTRPHLDATPVGLAVRQALRITVALAVTAGWWGLALAAAWPVGAGFPVAASSVLLGALVLVGLAVAAVAVRTSGGSGAVPAAMAVLTLAALAVVVPRLVTGGSTDLVMFPRHPVEPSAALDAAWRAAHQRWGAVALVAGLVLIWALSGPDARRVPGRRRACRLLRRVPEVHTYARSAR
jgi:hypothetical protein